MSENWQEELIKNPFRSGGDGVLALSSGNCPLPGFSGNYNIIPLSSFLSGFWPFFVCFYLESQHVFFLVLFIWILVIFVCFYLESQHDSFSVQIVKSNVFSSQWISPWGKYFPKQFGLHITKEIKHKHLSTFPDYALMLRTVYLQIKIKHKHLSTFPHYALMLRTVYL